MNEAMNIMRHESVFNPANYPYPFHVIGAGATGSRVFAALVELGITNIHVYDDDVIEDHNLCNQIYIAADINLPKVQGCANFVVRKCGLEEPPADMHFHEYRVTPAALQNYVRGGIVFILTDTMDSREKIFNGLVQRCANTENALISPNQLNNAPMLIIETRMGSTHGTVFSINPFNKKECDAWRNTLVDDTDPDNIELSPCGTTLSVGTTASLIANYAVWQMMQFFVDPVGMKPHVDFFFKPTLTITSSAIT
jgi:molybdopterin/thiamine biosynthesis adenylyltransferase